MGNGIELAKAYVQIVPSAEGIQGKITEVLGGESSKAGDAAGQLLGKKLVGAVAKVISAAGIGKILAESIASGGALQQSLGGVETLFKDSADKVKSYAAQAYKTVGLSANAYMEQTTSFAASLLASVSHDTNAATELANMAMVDMADNANKMGTDMQDIQNAYQGFAKQNYTMLDNLKLGYGGTQAEMQRLLQDAEKISGVHYDLGNLADMYSAIHVIQQEMDITGTTAKEATTTLTGSFSAMSAAFQNVLSSLSTGAYLSAPLAALVETSKTYLVDNLLPMVGNVLAGIPEVVYSLVPQLLQSGTELVNSLASGFAEGISIVVQLATGIVQAFPSLLANWKKIFQAILSVISAINWVSLGANILKGIGNGIKSMGSSLLEAFKGGFSSALNWIKNLPAQAVQWGKNLIKSFTNGLTGKGGAVGIGSILGTAGASIAENAKGGGKIDWAATWADANDDLANSAQAVADIAIPAYTKSGNAAANTAKKTAQAATVVNSYTDTLTEVVGKVTRTTQTVNEELSDGSEQTKKTITESSRQLVDGVLKDVKTITTVSSDGKKSVQQTAEVVRDVVSSVTSVSDAVLSGIQTNTKTITEILADGTEQQKQVITETYTEIIDGALRTVERVRTIAADGTETTTKSIKEASASSLSGLWKEFQTEADKGILGTFDTLVSAVKKQDWLSVGEWALSALYAGLAPSAKQQIESAGLAIIQQINKILLDGSSTLAQTAWQLGIHLANNISGGLSKALAGSSALSGIGKLLGIGGTAAATGAAGTAATGAAGSGLAALGISVPEIGMILLAVLGVGAVGYGIYKLVTKNKEKDTVSSAMSYKDLQDAYWYGNERAFAGYDYRTDPYTFNPNNSAVLGYQAKMQEQLARLTEVVQQYLPDVANQQIVLDDGTLVGKMAPGMNAELGQMQILSERGN